jgi:hypothetical protein
MKRKQEDLLWRALLGLSLILWIIAFWIFFQG